MSIVNTITKHRYKLVNVSMTESLVRMIFRFLAIGMAGLHTWAAILSQSMNADGISYLDIGDAYFRGDWNNAINPVWPPLYSWLLGLVNFIVKPTMEWQFPTVHILNFTIFLGTLACFEFTWKKLGNIASTPLHSGSIFLPDWSWWTIGYSLFIWISLDLIQIWAVTPDMLLAALVLLAAGLLIQIRQDAHRWVPFVFLGLVLGLGYLAKTFMFSIALVFLGLCLVVAGRTRRSIAKTLLATGIFLLVSLPFIFLISEKKGKFTIGEAGTVTYLRHVQNIPYPHWQGDPANNIVLAHPSRLIFSSPPVYEFGEPIGGTYPLSTDPSYWFEGIEIRFNLKDNLVRLFSSGLFYLDFFIRQQGILIACVVVMYGMGQWQKLPLAEILRRWALVIPAVIALGLYGLVLVSGRYIGAFVLLLWADILANVRLADTAKNKWWLKILSAMAAIGILANIAIFNLDGFNRLKPPVQPGSGEQITQTPPKPTEVARTLQQMGIREGDEVAIIGYGFDSFWARLARVKIVSEMLEWQSTDFWLGDAELQQKVLHAFASTGAKSIVAEYVPAYAHHDGWKQVGKSNYYIFLFKK